MRFSATILCLAFGLLSGCNTPTEDITALTWNFHQQKSDGFMNWQARMTSAINIHIAPREPSIIALQEIPNAVDGGLFGCNPSVPSADTAIGLFIDTLNIKISGSTAGPYALAWQVRNDSNWEGMPYFSCFMRQSLALVIDTRKVALANPQASIDQTCANETVGGWENRALADGAEYCLHGRGSPKHVYFAGSTLTYKSASDDVFRVNVFTVHPAAASPYKESQLQSIITKVIDIENNSTSDDIRLMEWFPPVILGDFNSFDSALPGIHSGYEALFMPQPPSEMSVIGDSVEPHPALPPAPIDLVKLGKQIWPEHTYAGSYAVRTYWQEENHQLEEPLGRLHSDHPMVFVTVRATHSLGNP